MQIQSRAIGTRVPATIARCVTAFAVKRQVKIAVSEDKTGTAESKNPSLTYGRPYTFLHAHIKNTRYYGFFRAPYPPLARSLLSLLCCPI
jgi:hypothetical protein